MDNRNNQVLYAPTQKAAPAVADLSSFYRNYTERIWEPDAVSGANTLSFIATPSGIVRIVTVIMGMNYDSVVDRVNIGAVIDEDTCVVTGKLNPAVREIIEFSGQIVLDENDYIEVSFYGCTAGDGLLSTTLGYDIKKY